MPAPNAESTESVTVRLLNPKGAVLAARTSAMLQIQDDDAFSGNGSRATVAALLLGQRCLCQKDVPQWTSGLASGRLDARTVKMDVHIPLACQSCVGRRCDLWTDGHTIHCASGHIYPPERWSTKARSIVLELWKDAKRAEGLRLLPRTEAHRRGCR